LDRVEYWNVDDLDAAVADDALSELEQNIKALIGRLSEPADWV
jgi:hypothetical protein